MFISFLGNLISPVLMHCLGQKQVLLIANLPRIAICMLLLFAKEVWHVILARAFDGLFLSIIVVTIPSYTAEIADVSTKICPHASSEDVCLGM